MHILDISIVIFIALELSNVILLYFKQDFKHGNTLFSFKGYEKSKNDDEIFQLIKYLGVWVANCKLIFILLLIPILFYGNDTLKLYSVIIMIVGVSVYYFTLYPLIKRMDQKNQLVVKGYSKTLTILISAIIAMYVVSTIIYIL